MKSKETTLVMIKPDGVRKKLQKEICARFERRGLVIVKRKKTKLSQKQSEQLYKTHLGKPFYNKLIDFVTSGPVEVLVLHGTEVIPRVRKIIGVTDYRKAKPGTIRYDFAESVNINVVHAADSLKSAERELALFFGKRK